jgi:hypothetical protein
MVTTFILIRYPGDPAVSIPSTTRAVEAPSPMARAAYIFARVAPGVHQATIYYQRSGPLDCRGDTARPLRTVADFPVGSWILVEQRADPGGASTLWRLACVGEWAVG